MHFVAFPLHDYIFLMFHFVFGLRNRKTRNRKISKHKDCKEVYSYKVLFGDAFDSEKCTVTPTKLCRIGFAMFEDSRHEDMCDSTLVGEENSGSSDEANKTNKTVPSMDVSGATKW